MRCVIEGCRSDSCGSHFCESHDGIWQKSAECFRYGAMAKIHSVLSDRTCAALVDFINRINAEQRNSLKDGA